jgi:hypothetical protein
MEDLKTNLDSLYSMYHRCVAYAFWVISVEFPASAR